MADYPYNRFKRNYYSKQETKKQMIYLFGGTVLIFTFLFILKNIFKEAFNKPSVLDEFFKKPSKHDKVKGESKGETLCREAAQRVFGVPFVKVRPDFLKNNVTGYNLELDIYNEDLKIAIEYNGRQHYEFVPFFHKNHEHFMNQKYRDEIKKMICKQQGIHLIEVSYETPPTEIETLIRLEAQRIRSSSTPTVIEATTKA